MWLAPDNAKKITAYVARTLSALYPENAHAYATNARRQVHKLHLLDTELRALLSNVHAKPFVVFHDAYQYFEHTYALNNIGVIMLNPGVPPSLKHLQGTRRKLHQTKAACVFREPQFSDRLVNTVIEGTDAESAVLDPLGIDLAAGEELYFDLLKNLANNLRRCLGRL